MGLRRCVVTAENKGTDSKKKSIQEIATSLELLGHYVSLRI